MEGFIAAIDKIFEHLPRLTRTAVFLYWTYVILQIAQKFVDKGSDSLTFGDGFLAGTYLLMANWYFKDKTNAETGG